MSFSGDLASLPIVDIIQIIHTSRKSGTLSVRCAKGESQLVFSDGYITSANHHSIHVRIGQILVDKGFIDRECLDQALLGQKQAGGDRRPLIAVLIEQGSITQDKAFRGLESLVELTIVEVLTWSDGTFLFDATRTETSDEYRYFPEQLKQNILVNAQGVLMDALRIYDEKMRDGTLEHIFFPAVHEETGSETALTQSLESFLADAPAEPAVEPPLPAPPELHTESIPVSPDNDHLLITAAELGALPEMDQLQISSILTRFSMDRGQFKGAGLTGSAPATIIIFSHDQFIIHLVSTVGRRSGCTILTPADSAKLSLLIERSSSLGSRPMVVLDETVFQGNRNGLESMLALLRQRQTVTPDCLLLRLKQTRVGADPAELPPDSTDEILLPRPLHDGSTGEYIVLLSQFLQSLDQTVTESLLRHHRQPVRSLAESVKRLDSLKEPPEIALELLHFTASFFTRVITFVAISTDLIAERGIGLQPGKRSQLSPPLKFRIPLSQESVLKTCVDDRALYLGEITDRLLEERLYPVIGAPRFRTVLTLPVITRDNVIALIYADFGQGRPQPVQQEFLEIASRYAGLVLDYSGFLKRFERLARTQENGIPR